MGQRPNLVGQRFGRLIIIEDAGYDNNKRILEKCQCDCGNIKIVRRGDLKSGKIQSCGCLGKERRLEGKKISNQNKKNNPSYRYDLTGQKFEKLTVLHFDKEYTIQMREKKNNTESYWYCQCDCGNYVRQTTSQLKLGLVKSCGCLVKEKLSIIMREYVQPLAVEKITQDLTGQRFGYLTVLGRGKTKYHNIHWICQCDCGNIKEIAGKSLRQGLTQSCGCIGNSLGENKIKNILLNNNINFVQEYKFEDLKDKSYLRFDFAIFDKDNNLIKLIEYDGKQHTQESSIWHTETVIKHDEMKDNYCKENNIPLLRIPYTDLEKINLEYLGL